MKPLEVWTCHRAENLKNKLSKIPKITTQQQWYWLRAVKLSAAAAATRRSTKVGGGGAHKLSAAARRGRRTVLSRLRVVVIVALIHVGLLLWQLENCFNNKPFIISRLLYVYEFSSRVFINQCWRNNMPSLNTSKRIYIKIDLRHNRRRNSLWYGLYSSIVMSLIILLYKYILPKWTIQQMTCFTIGPMSK